MKIYKRNYFLQFCLLISFGFMSCNSLEKNELKSGFVEVDGGKIYFETKGHGDAIILLHPGLTDLRMWKHQLNELSKNHKVVSYDQRGYGKSDLPSKNYSPNADLLALLDSLKIEKADFVGICMGALHAMEFALDYPERINTIALSGISFLNWKYSDDVIKKHLEFSSIVTEGPDQAIEALKTDPFWKQTYPSDIYKTAQKDFLDLLEENKTAFTANWQFKEQVFTTMDRVSEIDKPVLVIRPDNEVAYMIEIANWLIENLENVEQVNIKDGGHLSNMEKPEEFNKAIVDFLAKHK